MSKPIDENDTENFDRILEGLRDYADVLGGRADPATYVLHHPKTVDVRAIRNRLGLTQGDFAARYGFSIGAVRDWEQGRKRPEASARVLLTVIDREPEAVDRALSAA